MIRYPNGKKVVKNCTGDAISDGTIFSNRGMSLENDINISLQQYADAGIALISKRPTPINVVKVDYSRGALITQAYFEKQSTTDYNGVYKGKYIDFEAKSIAGKTSFPIHNITSHQINHLQKVIEHGGLAFFVISFESLNKVYLLDAQFVITFYLEGKRKSIPIQIIEDTGMEIKQGFIPRLFIIEAIDEVYFHEKIS